MSQIAGMEYGMDNEMDNGDLSQIICGDKVRLQQFLAKASDNAICTSAKPFQGFVVSSARD